MTGAKDKKRGGSSIREMQRRGWVPKWGVRDKSAMGGLLVEAFGQDGGVAKLEPIKSKRYSFPEVSVVAEGEEKKDKPVQLGLGLRLEH